MVNVFLIGDVMLGRQYRKMKKKNYKKVWGDSLKYIESCDIIVANLEMAITDHTKKYPNKVFNYRLDHNRALFYFLPLVSKTIFNTANNHILDFNLRGMVDTHNFINFIGCDSVGSGLIFEEVIKPSIRKIKGKIILTFGASDHYDYWEVGKSTNVKGNEGLWFIDLRDKTTGKSTQVNFCLDYLKKKIKEINPDLTIFSCHWGPNLVKKISPSIRNFGRKLIDCGVDIIHGHSAHHIIPPEKYKNGTIFYSLGDFVNDYDHSGPNNKQLSYGIYLKLLDKKEYDYKIHLFDHSDMNVKELEFNKINKQIS
tara:strand:- start:2111 stop:3043 length:933 start_codon:yes stop_codon:yes gene_type:complete